MDFGKIFMRQGILLGHFYATGYRVWRDLPHTPVTSLVKYLPPGYMVGSSLNKSCNIKDVRNNSLELSKTFSELLC